MYSLMMIIFVVILCVCCLIHTAVATSASASASPSAKQVTMRVGYFPNITHSQALLGLAKGTFKKALGNGVRLDAVAFNAGPSVIEALFAGSIDLAYIGPNPAISGYIRSNGKALRIIAGATSGGASLVVRRDVGIKAPADLAGKRIATPQLGNTQDIALRSYLSSVGLKPRERGGTVEVIPVANPDQLTLFMKREIDGAWTPEPWATRLVREAGGRIFVDERELWPSGQFVTTIVVARTGFIKSHRPLVKKWLKAHISLTQEILENPTTTLAVINTELKRLTGKALPQSVIEEAFSRMTPTYDPLTKSLVKTAQNAWEAGFLGTEKPDLSRIYDLTLLNEVLTGLGLERVF